MYIDYVFCNTPVCLQCSISEIEKLSDSHVNFISRSILLMDKPVVHQHSQPLFYQTNCLLQKLAVINNISGHGDISFLAASSECYVNNYYACIL